MVITQGHSLTICAWKLICFKMHFFPNFIEVMVLIYLTLNNTLAGLGQYLSSNLMLFLQHNI